jgi:hypothetical protein
VTTDHEPTPACYKRGCKQPSCVTAGRRYAKLLSIDIARGIRRLHDASQARAHIQRLQAHKWTHRQIAAAAGIPKSTVSTIAGGQPTTSRRNVAAILSVPIGPAPATPPKTQDATGTTRRIRGLVWMGYSLVNLACRLDMTEDRLSSIARSTVDVVRISEARKIARLYRELSQLPGPSSRAAGDARRKGWHGPLAWDAIDDPACDPETTGQATGTSRSKAVIDLELVARRTSQGHTAEQIAEEIGCHKRSVVRARRRAETALAA